MKIEIPNDLKNWYAISCPTAGLRFDARTLEFLDSNRDGHIRSDEVQAALAFIKERGVEPGQLAEPDPDAEAKLADVLKRIADLANAEPSEADKKAMADWGGSSRRRDLRRGPAIRRRHSFRTSRAYPTAGRRSRQRSWPQGHRAGTAPCRRAIRGRTGGCRWGWAAGTTAPKAAGCNPATMSRFRFVSWFSLANILIYKSIPLLWNS